MCVCGFFFYVDEKSLKKNDVDDLKVWLKSVLLNKVNEIKVNCFFLCINCCFPKCFFFVFPF